MTSSMITLTKKSNGVIKVEGDFKKPFDELPKKAQRKIIKLISKLK